MLQLATKILPMYSVSKFDLLPKAERQVARSVGEVFGQARPIRTTPSTPAAEPDPEPLCNRHKWRAGQCQACLVGKSCVANLAEVCPGTPQVVSRNASLKFGHSIQRIHTSEDISPVWLCGRCGAMGRKHFVGLQKICKGPPAVGTKGHAVLKRVGKGKSPDYNEGKGARILYRSAPGVGR